MKSFSIVLLDILYFILNIIFVLVSVFVPFYYSIVALAEPKTLVTVIQNVDYKQVVENSPEIKSVLKKYGVDEEKADKVMKSKQMGQLIEIYADEATEVLLDIPSDRIFNMDLVKELVEDNIDKAIHIAEDDMSINLADEEVKKTVNTYIEDNEESLEQYIPVLEQTQTVVKQIKTSQVIQRSFTPTYLVLFSAVVIIIMVAICCLKRREFKGILFLGLDFAVISMILGILIFFCKSTFVRLMAIKLSDFGVKIIESAVTVCVEKLIIALIGAVLFTFIFCIFYITLYCVKKKYAKATSETAVPEATQESIT